MSEIILKYRRSESCCILGKSRKNSIKIHQKLSNILANLQNCVKTQQKCQQCLTKKLRLENGLWILKRCKGVHCVDIGESFLTSIYLQKLASIQPRTSPIISRFRALGNFKLNFEITNRLFATQETLSGEDTCAMRCMRARNESTKSHLSP